MKIAVIGTGYVGLVTAVGLAYGKHQVIAVDIDQQKIANLNLPSLTKPSIFMPSFV